MSCLEGPELVTVSGLFLCACEGDLRRMNRSMEPVSCGLANDLAHQTGFNYVLRQKRMLHLRPIGAGSRIPNQCADAASSHPIFAATTSSRGRVLSQPSGWPFYSCQPNPSGHARTWAAAYWLMVVGAPSTRHSSGNRVMQQGATAQREAMIHAGARPVKAGCVRIRCVVIATAVQAHSTASACSHPG